MSACCSVARKESLSNPSCHSTIGHRKESGPVVLKRYGRLPLIRKKSHPFVHQPGRNGEEIYQRSIIDIESSPTPSTTALVNRNPSTPRANRGSASVSYYCTNSRLGIHLSGGESGQGAINKLIPTHVPREDGNEFRILATRRPGKRRRGAAICIAGWERER